MSWTILWSASALANASLVVALFVQGSWLQAVACAGMAVTSLMALVEHVRRDP